MRRKHHSQSNSKAFDAHACSKRHFIEVTSVSKTFVQNRRLILSQTEELRTEALKDVSFSIEEGEMVGLSGPNGAGKSTILRLLSGLLRPDSGTIKVGEFEAGKNRKKYVRQIGALFAGKQKLPWNVSIYDLLEWNGRLYGMEQAVLKKRIGYFAELLEFENALKKTSKKLSLGEQMKVGLTLAFLHNPSVVFLDEPTIGVDVTAKENIRRFLLQMNKTRNLTMLLTSHDASDIHSLCDRTLALEKGRLVEDRREKHKDDLQNNFLETI